MMYVPRQYDNSTIGLFAQLDPCDDVHFKTMGHSPVIPAKAGIHARGKWIPAYAGMTSLSVAWDCHAAPTKLKYTLNKEAILIADAISGKARPAAAN